MGETSRGKKLSCCPRGARRWSPSICLFVSFREFGISENGRQLSKCPPQTATESEEKDDELQLMPRNSQRTREPKHLHEVLALEKPGRSALVFGCNFTCPRDLRPMSCKHEGATQAGLTSCHRKVSRCCLRGSRGKMFIEGGIAIR